MSTYPSLSFGSKTFLSHVLKEAYCRYWAKQGKYIPSKHNFEISKGSITLEASGFEILVKQRAGKGNRVRGGWGEPNYRERVDFGKIVGEFALQKPGQPIQYFPTSKCILHYDKRGGVHAVPSNPSAFMD